VRLSPKDFPSRKPHIHHSTAPQLPHSPCPRAPKSPRPAPQSGPAGNQPPPVAVPRHPPGSNALHPLPLQEDCVIVCCPNAMSTSTRREGELAVQSQRCSVFFVEVLVAM
jgi:hypothetical protein